MNKKENILAIPSKDSFKDETIALLSNAGIPMEFTGKKLTTESYLPEVGEFTVALMRPKDIVRQVALARIPIGVAGSDSVQEYELQRRYPNPQYQIMPRNFVPYMPVQELAKLGISKCRMVLALPCDSDIQLISGKYRIATSYPWIAAQYLDPDNRLQFVWEEFSGSVEVTPALGLADAIVELVETGQSQDDNDLKEIRTLFNSEGLLIAGRFYKRGGNRFVDVIRDRIKKIL